MKYITALFDTFDDAQFAAQELVDAGIPRGNISFVANDASGVYAQKLQPSSATDAVTGGQGAGFGAIVGAVVGLGALLIPGIGPVIAAGPLVAGLATAGVGAAAGAVTGGIIASLIHTGVDEETAGYYAEGVRRGGTLINVQVENARYDEVVSLINNFNPVNITTRAEEWRAEGWQGFNEQAAPYTNQVEYRQTTTTTTSTQNGEQSYQSNRFNQPGYDTYMPDFREHFSNHYLLGGSAYTYDEFDPAYRFGYMLATDPRYGDFDWQTLEPQAQRDWTAHYTSPWDQVRSAVRYSWEKVRVPAF